MPDAQRRVHGARLLRKGGAVKMIHEHLHQCGAMQVRQLGNFADNAHVAKPLDRFAVLAVLVADQHHAMHRKFSGMQGRKREQRVIHRAQAAARGHQHRQFEFHHQVQHKLLLIHGH